MLALRSSPLVYWIGRSWLDRIGTELSESLAAVELAAHTDPFSPLLSDVHWSTAKSFDHRTSRTLLQTFRADDVQLRLGTPVPSPRRRHPRNLGPATRRRGS